MKVLLVKTSSMGDIIHSFPAVTDAVLANKNIEIDWAVEEAFADLPRMHPHVRQVIPCAIRRWRKHPLETWRNGEWAQFKKTINSENYDCVIDAQGLIKSAFVSSKVKNVPVHGLNRASIREPFATRFYQQAYDVSWQLHAVERVRSLFSQALQYEVPAELNYGLHVSCLPHCKIKPTRPYLVFIHATTWPDKHYPETYWRELALYASNHQLDVYIPWVSLGEKERAERIAFGNNNVRVLPKMALPDLSAVLVGAKACIAVDTGLAHLCAALSVPTVSLYGPTDPRKIGAYGKNQVFLSVSNPLPSYAHSLSQYGFVESAQQQSEPVLDTIHPAVFAGLKPAVIWEKLTQLMRNDVLNT